MQVSSTKNLKMDKDHQIFQLTAVFNYEPSLLFHIDLQYSLFHVATPQL